MQATDPQVSRAKFEREVAEFRAASEYHQGRGWFLVEAEFPQVFLVVGIAKARPHVLIFGVVLDYTDYDAQPPSVRFVDPFTRRPYRTEELLFPPLPRAQAPQAVALENFPEPVESPVEAVALLQSHAPDEVPFLCLSGVREYHDHPGHSGDVWDLHRASGEGRLARLVEVIHRYGVEPMSLNIQVQIGVGLTEAPPR